MTASTPAPAEVVAAGLDATDSPDTASAADAEYRFDPQHTCELLATSLAAVHDLVVGADVGGGRDGATRVSDGAPLLSAEAAVQRARRRVASGGLTVDPAYSHIELTRLLEILEAGVDAAGAVTTGDLVLTHGRAELSALRCRDGSAVGFDSWADAALADRHRDLAVAATSVASSLGPMLVPEFFEAYGRRPDPQKLDWWALAVQLTREDEAR